MYLLQPYDDALREILDHGVSRTNKRTGIKTRSIFGLSKRYKLNTGFFPIVTKRKVYPKSVFAELLWFLSGSTSNKDLKDLKCNFWTPWVDNEWTQKNGFADDVFGKVYGFQLRHFGGEYGNGNLIQPYRNDEEDKSENLYGKGGFDQLAWVINRIKEDHSCRRTLWSLWNPNDISKMKLPPCHVFFQILVDDDRNLSGILYQRSGDFPVGILANIQFYSALIIMIAQQTDCIPCEFIHMTADSHIYEDQIKGVEEYLALPEISSPKLEIKKAVDIFSYKPEDFIISDFLSGPKIEIPVAV